MKDLIEHILGNANAYINDYEKKDKLTDLEKGILHGLWYDADSIKNHLDMEIMSAEPEEAKELEAIKVELQIDNIVSKLQKLIDEK